MKCFKLLKSELDLANVRRELTRSELWVDMDARAGRPQTHANTHRIQLRTNKVIAGQSYHNIHEVVDLPAWHSLVETRLFVLGFLAEIGGELGHVRATALHGASEIVPHIDVGAYCAMRDRYHLVITSRSGTKFTAGDETVVMKENELWWFDNKQMHSVRNLGSENRIHLVFDILPVHRGSQARRTIEPSLRRAKL